MIYLNVGAGKSLRERDIIGIFDTDTATVSPITRDFLSRAERAGCTECPSLEIPKAFVVYRNGQGRTITCLSQFSSPSLLGRLERGAKADE